MKLPQFLKGLPAAAQKIGLTIYQAAMAESENEEKARSAAMAAINVRYQKSESGEWALKENIEGTDRSSVIRFMAGTPLDAAGLKWEAILIAPGLSLGYPKFFWSEDLLEASVDIFQGVDINAYELTADFFQHLNIPEIETLEKVKRYLTANKVGWVEKTWWEEGTGVKAIIHFLPDHAWIPKAIQDGQRKGNKDVLGLSIDTSIKGVEVSEDGWTAIWVTKILSCSSVDVVSRPAAGGKFIRAVAGLNKEINMEKLLKMIKAKRPDLLKGKEIDKLGDDEIMELARMAMEPGEDAGAAGAGEPAGAGGDDNGTRAAQAVTLEEMTAAINDATKNVELRAACGRLLDVTLEASSLPDAAAKRIRKRFDNSTFTKEEMEAAIKDETDYLASMSVPGFGVGDQTFVVGTGSLEKIEMAVDRMFGLTTDDITEMSAMTRLDGQPFFDNMRAAQDCEDVPRLTGLQELYVLLTGDSEVRGTFNRNGLSHDMRAAQAVTSATFSYILGNTMGRRLVKDYKKLNYNEDLLISLRKPVKDFREQEAVNLGYFGDLDTVNPETGDYQEISGVTDEESKYAIGQKGNILTITRKIIINDDMTLVQRLLGRLSRAARRTHAKYVWNFFLANANCSDGTAWFTAGHGNLGTTALTFAAALAAYKALATMTENDSGEAIGLLDDANVKPVLVYPPTLMETGEAIVNDDHYYSSNDLTAKTRNSLKGKIKGAQVSLLSDANDWGLLMPSSEMDMVEMGYLNGRQEPELFLADSPQSEQVLMADKVRYKIRHEYAGAVVDFRSGHKSVVA